jgi:uncharacterized protein
LREGARPSKITTHLMKTYVRAYEELNDFLAPDRTKSEFLFFFDSRTTVRQLLKSLKIPISSVDLVLANSRSVSPSHVLRDHERISLYPVFELLDISPVQRIRSRPLRRTRFAVGPGLAQLATYLRLFGFDVVQVDARSGEALKGSLSGRQRILLRKDSREQSQREIAHVLRIKESEPFHQFLEAVEQLDLERSLAPYTRCISCNRPLRRKGRRETSPFVRKPGSARPRCRMCTRTNPSLATEKHLMRKELPRTSVICLPCSIQKKS